MAIKKTSLKEPGFYINVCYQLQSKNTNWHTLHNKTGWKAEYSWKVDHEDKEHQKKVLKRIAHITKNWSEDSYQIVRVHTREVVILIKS